MSGSARENWVKALLPAAIVVLAYSLLINLNQQRQTKALRQQLQSVEQRAVTENDLLAAHQMVFAARRSLSEIERTGDEAARQVDQHLQAFRDGPAPSFMLELDRICRELSLSVLSQQAVTEVSLSAAKKASIGELRTALGDRGVGYRCLHVAGSYASMMRLLERLPDEIPRFVPLAVELMEVSAEAGRSPVREWKVYFLA